VEINVRTSKRAGYDECSFRPVYCNHDMVYVLVLRRDWLVVSRIL